MKITFLNVNASQIMLWNPIISLSYVLRLRMEIVRCQTVKTIPEFYPHEIFHEGVIFEIFLEKVQIFEFLQKMKGEMLLLYEFSRGNQVDGSPRVAIQLFKS